MPAGITHGGLTVKLAGQDITNYVSEETIKITDALAQGSGRSAGGTGRAKKGSVRVSLGPAASAIGAGQTIPASYTNLLSSQQADIESNSFPQPDFKTNLGSGGSISQDTSIAWHGTSSLKCIVATAGTYQSVSINLPTSKYVGGQTYTFSAYMWTNTGTPTLRFYCQANDLITGNASIGSVGNVTLSTTKTRYSFTITLPTDLSPYSIIGMRADTGGTAQAVTWWMDGLQIEKSSTAHAWIPGGTTVPPSLVRQGEIKFYDSTGACIFGGYATNLKDATEKTVNYTDIEFHDYWQDLDRITVNEVYDAQTDIFVIRDLITKYAPSIKLTYIPTTGYYNIGVKPYRNKTLQQALQNVSDITGYAIWVDSNKNLFYVQPTQAAAAPFSLSDNPDFRTSFQCNVTEYNVDDTSAINRVTFYGGKRLSNDFTQDISNQANGNNKTFTLAYYPHHAADGKFHVYINGVEKVLGFDGGTGAGNTLKSNGGGADVLLAVDSHVLTFDVAPASGASVTAKYRYESPLIVQLVDNNSVAFYGRYLDGTIVDTSVFDLSIAVQRCRILLLEQSMGLNSLKISCWKAGITAGQLLTVTHGVRGINNAFLVQQVDIKPLGAGNFQYDIQCGAWNWNLVDLVMKTAQAATPEDDSSTEQTSIAQVQTDSEIVNAHFVWTKSVRTTGQYYARTTAVGDGHDAYCGLCSI